MRMFTTYANADDTALAAALRDVDPSEAPMGRDAPVAELVIAPDAPRQRIDGFGASLTQASSHLWRHAIRHPHRALRDLFSVTDGIGISMLRQPVGPSDHVTRPYRFMRRRPDRHLRSLDFGAEARDVLPMVLAAQRVRMRSFADAGADEASRRPINIIVSPWSAPWWMKTNLSVLGKRRLTRLTGWLRPAAYPAYAEYLARFIAHYEEHGLPVFGVTPTNEPDYPQSRWPSMAMTPDQQARFIARFLKPRLRAHGLGDVRVMCWDHNYSTDHYPDGRFVRELYMHPRAFAATAGSAWHYYGGASRTMSDIHRLWPDKGIWVTEASGGDWGPRNWDDALVSMGARVIAMMNNWAQSAVLWNIALDTHGGPDYYYLRNDHAHSSNRGLLTVDRRTGDYVRNADYYVIGHFSKFVPIGSHCVEHALHGADGLHAAAFVTPDGAPVAVVCNERMAPAAMRVEPAGARGDARAATVTLPARSLTTLLP